MALHSGLARGSESVDLASETGDGQADVILTLSDLALVIDGAHVIPEETHDRLRDFLLSDPRLKDSIAFLESLAAERNKSGSSLEYGLFLHQLDLLSSSVSWQHPDDVLEGNLRVETFDFVVLIDLAQEMSRELAAEPDGVSRHSERLARLWVVCEKLRPLAEEGRSRSRGSRELNPCGHE